MIKINGITKTRQIHQIVLEVFIGPRPPGMEAAHLDGNRANPSADNLKWVTRSENQMHRRLHGTSNGGERHRMARLKEKDIYQIKKLFEDGLSIQQMASIFKVTYRHILAIVNGQKWNYLGLFGDKSRKYLTPEQVRLIRILYQDGISQSEIGKKFDRDQTTISEIVRGVIWANIA